MDAEERLRVEGLSLTPGGEKQDEAMRRGEIIGLAGLDGHGQEAFLEILAGLRRAVSGRVLLRPAASDAVAVTGFRQATRAGVAYLAKDRRASLDENP